MLSFNSILFILVSITTHINAQIISCSGNCGCPTAPTGTTCILDCGGGQDNCKGKTLTCRANDPCTILCDAKATCSDGTTINAATATDVTVLCNGDDACKTKIDISCGTGHCELQCTGSFSTACQEFGSIDTTNADSFDCIGDCPASIPAAFSGSPTSSPTNIPSATPTIQSTSPTPAPTTNPTPAPTLAPTAPPTSAPTYNPTSTPSNAPTSPPSNAPTLTPTNSPSNAPTHPTATPTNIPTSQPTMDPTYDPTIDPTVDPTVDPTTDPTYDPTNNPTMAPTNAPSANPTTAPSVAPSMPSLNPSSNPTSAPTIYPTNYPSSQPTVHPTSVPTFHPTFNPTLNPTFDPSTNPTSDPTYNPTSSPSNQPSDSPTNNPTAAPTNNPSKSPSYEPTIRPSLSPTVPTTSTPSMHPTDSDDAPVNASAELQTNGNTTHTIDGVTVAVMIISCLIGLCCVVLCFLRKKQLKNKRNKQLFGEEEMPSKSNISSQISSWRSKSASSASTNHACASPQSAARSNAQLKSVKEEKPNWEFEVEICTPKGTDMSHNYVTQLMLQNTMNNATHSNNSGHSARTEPLKNNNIQPTEIRRAMSQNNCAYPYAHNYVQYHPMTPGQCQFGPSTMPLTPPYAYQMAAQSQSQRNMAANANAMSPYTHGMAAPQAFFVTGMQLPAQQSQHSLHHSHGSQHTGNNPGLPPPQLSDVCSDAVGAELSDISSSEDGDESESESESIRTSESDSSEMTGNSNNEDTVVGKLLIQNEV